MFKTMRRKWMFLTASLMAAVLAVSSYASLRYGGGHHDGRHVGHAMAMISEKLDFSEDQEAKLTAIHDEMMRLRKEHEGQREQQFAEITALIQADQFDTNEVIGLFDGHIQRLSQSSGPVLERIGELHASLTQEQKDRIVAFMEKHRERH